MKLTAEQLKTLRAVPLGGMPNRLRIALALSGSRQADVVEVTGIAAPHLSKMVGGKYGDIVLSTAQRLADYFGCSVEDLFPAPVNDDVSDGDRRQRERRDGERRTGEDRRSAEV